jgi:rubrerythrin
MNTTTRENLLASMQGEAYAHARYVLYGDIAKSEGLHEIAELFYATAKTELYEHFAELAGLAVAAGTTAENLRAAAGGEAFEVDTMYVEYARQARGAGETAAAERFEEVRGDEMKHRAAFTEALAKLGMPVG